MITVITTNNIKIGSLTCNFIYEHPDLLERFTEWVKNQHHNALNGTPCSNSDRCRYENGTTEDWADSLEESCLNLSSLAIQMMATETHNLSELN